MAWSWQATPPGRDITATVPSIAGQCAGQSNLKLHELCEPCEVIFRQLADVVEPASLSGISRSRNLKVLGVVIRHEFSVTQHVQRLATSSAQTMHALRVLRTQRRGTAARCLSIHRHRETDVVHLSQSQAPFTRYNLLSNTLSNRLYNRLYRVNGVSPSHPTRITSTRSLKTMVSFRFMTL